mmetsp:Transcript_24031/g.49965  ORF Transcript_24031/g.49965 Transcript_24031/m.49965 type:complete len:257 (+) Transcript_24031:180-950(+)
MDCSSQAELLDRVLACRELCRNDAQDREHCKAAVPELLVPHLKRVHVQAQRVAKVPTVRAFPGSLVPRLLRECAQNGKRKHTQDALGILDREETCVDVLEVWKCDVVLDNSTHCGHHGHAAMLELRSPELLKASLIANLAKACWVEEAQRWHGPSLLSGIERRWRGWCFNLSSGAPGETVMAPCHALGTRDGTSQCNTQADEHGCVGSATAAAAIAGSWGDSCLGKALAQERSFDLRSQRGLTRQESQGRMAADKA